MDGRMACSTTGDGQLGASMQAAVALWGGTPLHACRAFSAHQAPACMQSIFSTSGTCMHAEHFQHIRHWLHACRCATASRAPTISHACRQSVFSAARQMTGGRGQRNQSAQSVQRKQRA
eukprot:366392-Chlamydomonas_euryale.AAC.4